jgi:uncharacterized membrane protein YkvA (DUF1232 family)
VFDRARSALERLKHEVIALWFAYRHPDTPWYAKAWVALVVGYAFSPIDLIPDFIPVIGLLDDLLLVPAGIWIALKMIPPHVMADARERARAWSEQRLERPQSRTAAVVIVLLWVVAMTLLLVWAWRAFGH